MKGASTGRGFFNIAVLFWKTKEQKRIDYDRVHGTSFDDKMWSVERPQHECYVYTNSFPFHSSSELCAKLKLPRWAIHWRIGILTVKPDVVLIGTFAKLRGNVLMFIGSLSRSFVVSAISDFHFRIKWNNITYLWCTMVDSLATDFKK